MSNLVNVLLRDCLKVNIKYKFFNEKIWLSCMLHQSPLFASCCDTQQLPAPSILIKFQLTPLHSKNWANYAFIRVFMSNATDTFIWCKLTIESQWTFWIFWFPKLKYFMTILDMSQMCFLWCFQKIDDKLNEICLWRPTIIVFIKH